MPSQPDNTKPSAQKFWLIRKMDLRPCPPVFAGGLFLCHDTPRILDCNRHA
jgi:hypothetical protein